jgi:hypothetical protein
VTDAERVYLDNLLTVGRVSLHALGRAIRYESDAEQLRALADEQAAIAADVVRLTLVLGA